MTSLRRKMREDLQIRNFAPSTQKGYLWRVGQFARHFRRSPDQLGLKEIHQYQVHLVESGIHYGSLQQAVSALRFFYGVTLGKKWVIENRTRRRNGSFPTSPHVRRKEGVPFLVET